MNTDLIDAIGLPALAVALPAILIRNSPLGAGDRRRLSLLAGGWFVLVTALAAAHFFSTGRQGAPALGLAFALPVITAFVALRRSVTVQTLAAGVPLVLLVALHVTRLLGVQFLILHAAHRLPTLFALCAGWGDILVALAAVPAALAIHRRAPHWRRSTLAWNVAGTLDLLIAMTLGVGSNPGSPLRFIHEAPGTGIMGELPWFLIPGFLVPFFLILHLFVFRQLRAASSRQGGGVEAPLPVARAS